MRYKTFDVYFEYQEQRREGFSQTVVIFNQKKMKIETIQNFTILSDVKSPLDTDFTNVPRKKFLRIIVKGELDKSDSIKLNKLASNFEKYSIVIQTEGITDIGFLKWMKNLNHFSINRYSAKDLESFIYLPDTLEYLSIASLNSSRRRTNP